MEQNPSWQANSSLASQSIVLVWWSPKVHYSGHNSRPFIPILSKINPADALSPSFLKVRFSIILSSTSRSTEWSHSSRFFQQNPALLFTPVCTTWPTYIILLDLIAQTVFGEEYQLWSISLRDFLPTPVTSSLLHTKSLQLEHPHSMPLSLL
jgi:hypothetical protein